MLSELDLIGTILDDDEVLEEPETDSEDGEVSLCLGLHAASLVVDSEP